MFEAEDKCNGYTAGKEVFVFWYTVTRVKNVVLDLDQPEMKAKCGKYMFRKRTVGCISKTNFIKVKCSHKFY